MWIKRDFCSEVNLIEALPVKVLKGPRQVGKTSFLEKLGTHKVVYFDDVSLRLQAQENPRFFLDNLPAKLILDEGSLVPALFPELKRRIDEQRRNRDQAKSIDYWITGSNQTLLRQNVRETLAGRASYFDFNTLSIHELGDYFNLSDLLLRGGWPELYVSRGLNPVRYLNDLISTFIEKDIVAAAGIERQASFTKFLQLSAGRIGQLFNASDIAKTAGVDSTTISSWATILEDNGVMRMVSSYWTNRNKRLIKSPKLYFEDVSLAVRFQGWTEPGPIIVSPAFGHFLENIALNEITRFFINRGEIPQINFLRSKEKVEVDFIIHLPNQRAIVAEVKLTPQDFSPEQMKLIDTLDLNVVAHWVISPTPAGPYPHSKVVQLTEIWKELKNVA